MQQKTAWYNSRNLRNLTGAECMKMVKCPDRIPHGLR